MTAKNESLIDAAWLANHLSNPGVRVLDCSWFLPTENRDAFEEYRNEHIPGAIFLEWAACSGEDSTDTMLYLPTPTQFTAHMGALGIGDDDLVVAYDAEGIHSIAARAWWMFRVFGHDNVRLLDGGLAAWKEAGCPAERAAPEIQPVTRSPAGLNKRLVRTYPQMLANVQTGGEQVVDVRAAARYSGEAAQDKHPGHIPGAVNLPFSEFVGESGHELIAAPAMKKHFENAGIDLEMSTVVYCGGGGSSPVTAFAAYLLGQTEVAVYDGAWGDWTSHAGSPIATGG